MKVIKTASGKNRIKISKKEWTSIGKKAGWLKDAQGPYFYFDHNEKEIKPGDYLEFPGLFGISDSGILRNIRHMGDAEGQDHLLRDYEGIPGAKMVNIKFFISDSIHEIGNSPLSRRLIEENPDIEADLLKPRESWIEIPCVQIGKMISCFCFKFDKPDGKSRDFPEDGADWWK
jgi:hypothetical protein